ncbi:MAG: ScyD/ScyE family protein [Acidobacteriota bacterium]
MKKFVLALALLVTTGLFGQATPYVTGLRAPVESAFTHQGNLIVAEEGTAAANTGRISLIDRTSVTRRTLVEGLPSAVYNGGEPAPSGPDGLALVGATLYVTIGGGDTSVAGPVQASDTPNPAGPSSPLFVSLLALTPSESLDTIEGGFTLLPSQHATIRGGETVTLSNGHGETLGVRLVAKFPDYVAEPRPDFAGNVRIGNPFGVAAHGASLYVVDASMNVVRRVNPADGTFTTLITYPKLANPTPVGPPFIDPVPDSLRVRGDALLVTNLTGFPFPAGSAEVKRLDPVTGASTSVITGLTSAIDSAPLGSTETSPLLVLEFSKAMLTGGTGRLRLFGTAETPVLVADNLITPTSLSVDPRSGEIFITNIGPGMVTRINAAGTIPAQSPTAILAGVGSTAGAFGSHWVTPAQISNPHPFPISGKIVFHPAGVSAAPSDPSLSYTLAPFATKTYDDLVAATGGSGIGSVDVIAAVGGAPVMVTRVRDTASANHASAQVPLVDPADALWAGSIGSLITPGTAGTRFNIGIRTLSEGVSLTIEQHDTNGAVVATVHRAVPANTFVQIPADVLLGAAPGPNQALTFTVDSGSAIVYGAGVDNDASGMTLQLASSTPQ